MHLQSFDAFVYKKKKVEKKIIFLFFPPLYHSDYTYLMFDNSPNNTVFGRDNFELVVAHVALVLSANGLNCTQT